MPVCGLRRGAILPACYYYSIKIRRGGPAGPPRRTPGGLGASGPQVCRGTGAEPLLSAARQRDRRVAGAANTRPSARRCRCARRSARRDKRGGECYPRPAPPQPPARLGGTQGRGRATQAEHQPRRNVPGLGWSAGRRWPPAHYHTGAGGRGAPTARPSAQPGTGARLPRRGTAAGGCGLAPGLGARYGCRAPSRRRGGGLDRGRRLRRPARHRCVASAASGAGAAPSRAGWGGVGPQAVGCGRLPSGSRGHPIPAGRGMSKAPRWLAGGLGTQIWGGLGRAGRSDSAARSMLPMSSGGQYLAHQGGRARRVSRPQAVAA